jgi:DNA invertase Pin-like site-specific DNA recombinase
VADPIQKVRRRAAAYARMSTDRQNHSIRHQLALIDLYARDHDLELVKEYVDEGKSGLAINGRDGLRSLMTDVIGGAADFQFVLVYDVSRWGRFQDVDESAHYEFMCRKEGIEVIYCSEQFANDGSPMSAIMKMMKRVMAAEYSRELSAKVLRAQCRLVAQGYKQGGPAGYGLRRTLIDESGNVRGILNFGDRKGLQTDRVILTLGPEQEIRVVHRIFDLYLKEKMQDTKIAARLNDEGIPAEYGNPWNAHAVSVVLTSEKYCGVLIFNRSSTRLKAARVKNPESDWVRCENAFPRIISNRMHKEALAERARRLASPTREYVLETIRAIYAEHGEITKALMRKRKDSPRRNTILRLFGSYAKAYELAGVGSTRTISGMGTKHMLAPLMNKLLKDVLAIIQRTNVDVTVQSGYAGTYLTLNGSCILRVCATLCYKHPTHPDTRWRIPIRRSTHADFVLVGKLNVANSAFDDYYLFDTARYSQRSVWLSLKNLHVHGHERHECLENIFLSSFDSAIR